MSSSVLKTTNFKIMTNDNKQHKPLDSTEPTIAYSTCYRQYGINVLSLFDGISCGQIALERVGFKVRQYFASEIKPHAIRCTQHNFPNTIQIGDVVLPVPVAVVTAGAGQEDALSCFCIPARPGACREIAIKEIKIMYSIMVFIESKG